jgi:hypothetical protein
VKCRIPTIISWWAVEGLEDVTVGGTAVRVIKVGQQGQVLMMRTLLSKMAVTVTPTTTSTRMMDCRGWRLTTPTTFIITRRAQDGLQQVNRITHLPIIVLAHLLLLLLLLPHSSVWRLLLKLQFLESDYMTNPILRKLPPPTNQ